MTNCIAENSKTREEMRHIGIRRAARAEWYANTLDLLSKKNPERRDIAFAAMHKKLKASKDSADFWMNDVAVHLWSEDKSGRAAEEWKQEFKTELDTLSPLEKSTLILLDQYDTMVNLDPTRDTIHPDKTLYAQTALKGGTAPVHAQLSMKDFEDARNEFLSEFEKATSFSKTPFAHSSHVAKLSGNVNILASAQEYLTDIAKKYTVKVDPNHKILGSRTAVQL